MQKVIGDSLKVSPERADAAKNRQRILGAVRRLLGTTSFEEIKMQDVAKAAGVGQGTLYRRFANKGELSEALFAEDLIVFREAAEAYLGHAQDAPALERLEWLVAAKIRFIDEHLSLFLSAHENAGPTRFDLFKKDHHLWMVEHVGRLLRASQVAGETDLSDVVYTTDVLLAAFSPPLLAYQRRVLGFTLERVIGGVTELFITNLRGIRTEAVAQLRGRRLGNRSEEACATQETDVTGVAKELSAPPARACEFSTEDLAYFERLRKDRRQTR